MKIDFNQYGEIKANPDLPYELVYDPKNNRTYKIKKDIYKYKEIRISSDEILSCGSTPVVLLEARGENKYVDWYAYIEYTFGTIAYTMGSGFAIQQGTVNKMPIGLLATNSENYATIVRPSFGTGTGYAFALNKNLILSTVSGADPTDGDGTILVRLFYKDITFKTN